MEDVTKWNLTSVDFDPNFVNNKIDVTQNYFQTSLVSFMFQKISDANSSYFLSKYLL